MVIIDELLLLQAMLKKGVDSPLGEMLAVGRKAAYTLIGCSQLSQKEVIGDVRDLWPQRVALACRSRELTDAILGPGATAGGAEAHRISETMPGTGFKYVAGLHRGYVRFRGAYIPDEVADVIAAGGYVVEVPGIPQQDMPSLAAGGSGVAI
jgi:hypothetical protein